MKHSEQIKNTIWKKKRWLGGSSIPQCGTCCLQSPKRPSRIAAGWTGAAVCLLLGTGRPARALLKGLQVWGPALRCCPAHPPHSEHTYPTKLPNTCATCYRQLQRDGIVGKCDVSQNSVVQISAVMEVTSTSAAPIWSPWATCGSWVLTMSLVWRNSNLLNFKLKLG